MSGLREPAHVELRHARAVRGAIQVDLAVPERLAHALEIEHRHARGVEAHALAVLRQALAGRLPDDGQLLAASLPVVGVAAEQRRGFAGAALVHEHDVVIAVDARERARKTHVQIRGSLAGSSSEQEQGRGGGAAIERRHHGDAQIDRRSRRSRGILRHPQPAAARGHRRELERMFEPAIVQAERGGSRQRGGRPHGEDRKKRARKPPHAALPPAPEGLV